MNFKASIVVPVFNSETYISSAIESILNQDEADFQLIIANDGSTDNTLEIINDFRKQDKRIEVYSHKNKGMGETLNEAIEKSKSNIIFRMDSDDIMQSNRIKKQLTFLKKNSDIHFSSCFYELIDEKGNILGRKSSDLVTNKAVKNKLAKDKVFGILHPGAVFYRDFFLKVGGYRKQFWPCDDIDLWARMIESGGRIRVQPEFLMKYRIHCSSISMNQINKNKLLLQWVKACKEARKNKEKEPTYQVFIKRNSKRSLLLKLNDKRKRYAFYFASKAKFMLLKKNIIGLFFLSLLSLILNPNYIIGKLCVFKFGKKN